VVVGLVLCVLCWVVVGDVDDAGGGAGRRAVFDERDVGKGRRCENGTPLSFRDAEDLSKLLADLGS